MPRKFKRNRGRNEQNIEVSEKGLEEQKKKKE